MKNQITLDIHLPGKNGIKLLNSPNEQEGFFGTEDNKPGRWVLPAAL